MSFLTPSTPPATVINAPAAAVAATPPPVLAPQGSKPSVKSPQKTVLGGGDIANPAGLSSGAQTGKTLLGA